MKRIAFGSLILICCSTCHRDEVSSRPYPRVLTGAVTDISSKGAQFQGDITYASVEIRDHGFVWSTDIRPEFSNGDIVSLGPKDGKGHFESYVAKGMAAGSIYYVRAYAKSDDYLVYGNPVPFQSLGSEAPKIDGFAPTTADVGDTIVIRGKNFSQKNENNEVRFNSSVSPVIFANDSILKVRVPRELADLSSQVSVSVLGNRVVAAGSLTLRPLQLISSDKIAIRICDTLSLTTAHLLNADLDQINIFFNGQKTTPLSRNGNVLRVKVPFIPVSSTSITLKIAYGNLQSTLPSVINFLQPAIQSISPAAAEFLDTLTVSISNFPVCGSTFKIGGIQVIPIDIKNSYFKVIVPAELVENSINVKSFVDGNLLAESTIPRILRVDSFQPNSGTFDDIITIYGAGFHPDPEQNIVRLDNLFTQTQVVSSSAHRITIKIPRNFSSLDDGNVNVSVLVAGLTVNKDNVFRLNPPVITSITPSTIVNGTTVTVSGSNFNPDLSYNSLTLDQNFHKPLNITSASTTQLTFEATNEAIENQNSYLSSSYASDVTLNVSGQSVAAGAPIQLDYIGPWTKKSDFPGINRRYESSFVFGNTLYVGLGKNADDLSTVLNDFWKYDLTLDQWVQLSDFPGTARNLAATWILDGIGYLGFGESGTGGRLKDIWRFDPATDSWTQMADFPGTPLERESAVVFNNVAYVVAGDYHDFWKVDQSGNWLPLNDVPENVGALVASQNSIYGMMGPASTSVGWKLYQYDRTADSWNVTSVEASVFYWLFSAYGRAAYTFPANPNGLATLNEATMQWEEIYSPIPIFQVFYTPYPFFAQNKIYLLSRDHMFYQFDKTYYPPH